jgi:hypothetical protein
MTVATIMVATMTDPMSPSNAERLAALRRPSKKRTKPAHTSKVLSAGISTTALFGMVAAMGWQTGTSTAQSISATVPAVMTTQPAPVQPTVAPLVPTAPTTTAIPVAVPATQPPVQTSARSNTVTKSSG